MITLDLERELAGLAKKSGLRLLVAFGSAARGKANPRDLDLAMLPGSGWLTPMPDSLWADWSHSLGRGDLDLIWLPSANWQVTRQVALHGVPLHESEPGEWRQFARTAHLRSCLSDPWRRREQDYLERFLQGSTALDHDLVRKKANQLRQYFGDLESVLRTPSGEFAEGAMHYAAERLLELLVEAAAWINTEVAQSCGIPPSDYDSSFFSMARTGWIDNETAEALAELARLRNALVHHYEDVPLEKLQARLSASLKPWRAYLAAVTQRLR